MKSQELTCLKESIRMLAERRDISLLLIIARTIINEIERECDGPTPTQEQLLEQADLGLDGLVHIFEFGPQPDDGDEDERF